MSFFAKIFRPTSVTDKVIKKYYRDYPEKPFINPNRDFNKWSSMIEMFPNKLVAPSKMLRNDDNLLPGHVYQLYWINKFPKKKSIPAYFEYEFGIDFDAEKVFLQKEGYLINNTITNKGKTIIQKYYQVIDEKNGTNNGVKSIPKLDLQKELAQFKKEKREYERITKEPYYIEQDEIISYVYEMNGIAYYKEKDFSEAEKEFLKCFEFDYHLINATNYLAKIYRKKKDYVSEISILEKAIQRLSTAKKLKIEWESAKDGLLYRLDKAKQLESKKLK